MSTPLPQPDIPGILTFAIAGTFFLAVFFSPRAARWLSLALVILANRIDMHADGMAGAYASYRDITRSRSGKPRGPHPAIPRALHVIRRENAIRIWSSDGKESLSSEQIAAILDRESGYSVLVEALEEMLKWQHGIPAKNGARCETESEMIEMARAALAKASPEGI